MAVKLRRGSALGALSMTPLIDIVFLLLIFFIVTSRFAQEDQEMDVQLPTATEARPLIMEPKELIVHIDEQGELYMGRQHLGVNDLERHLEQLVLQNPLHQSVVLRADRRCSWERVSAVIDACHRAGIHDIRPTTMTE